MIARQAIDIADADLVSVGPAHPGRHRVRGRGRVRRRRRRAGRPPVPAGRDAGRPGRRRPGVPLLVSSARTTATDRSLGTSPSVIDAGPLMVLPLQGTGRACAACSVSMRTPRPARRSPDATSTMAAGFASHASVALELADSRAAEQKLVLLEDRDRIATRPARPRHPGAVRDRAEPGGVAARSVPDDAARAARPASGSRTSTAPSGGSARASSNCADRWTPRRRPAPAGARDRQRPDAGARLRAARRLRRAGRHRRRRRAGRRRRRRACVRRSPTSPSTPARRTASVDVQRRDGRAHRHRDRQRDRRRRPRHAAAAPPTCAARPSKRGGTFELDAGTIRRHRR